jgi:hypothetical protein
MVPFVGNGEGMRTTLTLGLLSLLLLFAPSCGQTYNRYSMAVDPSRVAVLEERDIEVILYVLQSDSSNPKDRIYFLTVTPMSDWGEGGDWADPPQSLLDYVASNGNKYRPASGAIERDGCVLERGTNKKAWMKWITIKRWISDTEVEVEEGIWCRPMGGGAMTTTYEKRHGVWRFKSRGDSWISDARRRTNDCTQAAIGCTEISMIYSAAG